MLIIVPGLLCSVSLLYLSLLLDADGISVFEGDGKAVLYTGDIRSEPWFVNNLTRNPFLIEYTSGMKTLDSIYLDTSNIDPKSFPTKAEGLKELVRKVSQYPEDTVFHFSAWTWGYEDVYVALSRALKSQVPLHLLFPLHSNGNQ